MEAHAPSWADGLGLRGSTDRRHHHERRGRTRDGGDRRHGDRRRRRLRTFIFSAVALSSTAAPRVGALVPIPFTIAAHRQPPPGPVARVTTFETGFSAVSAQRAYEPYIREAARRYHLDPALIRAVIQTESAFDATALSTGGAMGLMQLMPDVAGDMGVTDPFDPRENILAGSRYLRRLLTVHEGDLALALASYNAGLRRVMRYGAIPPFEETQEYVKRVTALASAKPAP